MEKRKFTKEEKLKIIKEASEQGVKQTLEKYSVFPASYYAWKKKMETMGEEGFSHGMTPDQLKRIRELEKENKLLKEIVIQKELEGKLKDELLKKKLALEKKEIVRSYIFQGLKAEVAFQISGITKHQYYYQKKKTKQGRVCSINTFYTDSYGQKAEVSNDFVTQEMKQVHQDSDTDYGYQKMKTALQIKGYNINHKKVYRLMKEAQLLQEKHQKPSKTRVKYRKVFPSQPFEVLEMDIKFVWVEEYKMHCYVLTTIDTFTRIVLHWMVAYSIKKQDVKRAWEHIIINHLQPNNCLERGINIEVRNDNDSRFSAKLIQEFFKENYLNQVFTHPYTPQENGHIESFHAILAKKLRPFNFWSIDELEEVLTLFYEKYNNERLHSSVCNLPPNIFLECWNKGLIEQNRDEIKWKIKFKLKIPYNQISGNTSLKCSSLRNLVIPPFSADELNFNKNEMIRPETSLQTSV